MGAEDLVCEVGAGFEGEGFGEDERVVAVEEDGGDLGVVSLDWRARAARKRSKERRLGVRGNRGMKELEVRAESAAA